MSPEELAAVVEYRAEVLGHLETMVATAVLVGSVLVFLLTVLTVRKL